MFFLWHRRKLIWNRQDSKTEDTSVFYYCMTNFHRFSSLKQHSLIYSSSGRSEVWHGMDGFSAWDITGWNQGVNETFSSGGEKTTNKLIHVGRIQLLAFVGQTSPIPCWLSPSGHSQLQRPPTFLTMWFLPYSSQQVLLTLPISNFLFLTPSLRFKGLMWLGQVYPDNLSALTLTDLGPEL